MRKLSMLLVLIALVSVSAPAFAQQQCDIAFNATAYDGPQGSWCWLTGPTCWYCWDTQAGVGCAKNNVGCVPRVPTYYPSGQNRPIRDGNDRGRLACVPKRNDVKHPPLTIDKLL